MNSTEYHFKILSYIIVLHLNPFLLSIHFDLRTENDTLVAKQLMSSQFKLKHSEVMKSFNMRFMLEFKFSSS